MATLLRVTESVGANNEVTGMVGKIIRPGQRSVARLWWQNEDVDDGVLIDSTYDIELANLTDVNISAGTPLKLDYDRQEQNWRVLDIKTPSLFTGHLDADRSIAQNGNYTIIWTKDLLEGGDLEHFTPDKDIAFEAAGLYEITVTISFVPDPFPGPGTRAIFHIDFILGGNAIFFQHVCDSKPGAWHEADTITFQHTFESFGGGEEIQVLLTEHNIDDLILRGDSDPANSRCLVSVKRLRR